jgi:hypothetical protein
VIKKLNIVFIFYSIGASIETVVFASFNAVVFFVFESDILFIFFCCVGVFQKIIYWLFSQENLTYVYISNFIFIFIDSKKMIVEQVLLGLAGLAASYYSIYVKKQVAKNPKYKALCDLGPNASCTKVLTSQ